MGSGLQEHVSRTYVVNVRKAMEKESKESMTSAEEFVEKVKGKRIVDVSIVDGAEDLEAGNCQFEFVTEDGYRFVG